MGGILGQLGLGLGLGFGLGLGLGLGLGAQAVLQNELGRDLGRELAVADLARSGLAHSPSWDIYIYTYI